MAKTTTKTLRYVITRGRRTNSVNATVISAAGCNPVYFTTVPGILKILQILLAGITLGFMASMKVAPAVGAAFFTTTPQVQRNEDVLIQSDYFNTTMLFPMELLRRGEEYFLCCVSSSLILPAILLLSYLFDTVSSMVVPKLSSVEIVANLILGLLCLTGGLLEISVTELSEWGNEYTFPWVEGTDNIFRLTAGALTLLNAVLFFAAFVLAKRELAGPRGKDGTLLNEPGYNPIHNGY